VTDFEADSESRRTTRFSSQDGRLHPLGRLAIYIALLAAVYLGLKLALQLLIVSLELPWSMLHEMVTAAAVVVLATWFCRRFVDRRDLASLGFGLHRRWWLDVGTGLLLGAVFVGAIFLVELSFGWIEVTGYAWKTRPFGGFMGGLATVTVSMLAVAVMEETFCRGYLLQTLEEAWGTPVAVLVSSMVFGVMHIFNPTAEGWANYVVPFTLTLAGMMFAMAYLVGRSLWLPIALHTAWNVFEYDVFGLAGASTERARLLATEITGPTAWVGLPHSAFGPEVGVLGVAAMLLCTGVLWVLKSRRAEQASG